MTTTRRGARTDRPATMAADADDDKDETAVPGVSSSSASAASASPSRTPPYLPTPLETVVLAIFPALLVFGSLFSVINPETRAAPYDPVAQAHVQDPAASPNYFARKSNLFNVVFVKRGWAWTIFAFAAFVCTHPSFGPAGVAPTPKRVRAGLRSVLVTAWWLLMTQWCFGPPIIDRGFRWTGGRCEVAEAEVVGADRGLGASVAVGDRVTAVACKAAGGRWQGGHDISGHVFLLVLGTAFLMQEVGWPVLRWTAWQREQRCVVMPDGAVKTAAVEAEARTGERLGRPPLGWGGKTAVAVMSLSLWMLLMTAIYFHTWFEKVSE